MTKQVANEDMLMQQLAKGENHAFVELFARYESCVFGLCMRIFAGNRSLVDEVVQESWLKVVQGAAGYQARGNFKAWLMTIVRNEAMTKFRREGRNAHAQEEEGEMIASSENLELNFLRASDAASIRTAIDSLSDSPRMALSLWLSDDATYEDVAIAMKISVEAVRSLLYRAKRELKAKLEKKRETRS